MIAKWFGFLFFNKRFTSVVFPLPKKPVKKSQKIIIQALINKKLPTSYPVYRIKVISRKEFQISNLILMIM
jgi:hypothetical protein